MIPEFAGRHHEQQEWKRRVLARAIELAELDTSPEVLSRPERRAIETA